MSHSHKHDKTCCITCRVDNKKRRDRNEDDCALRCRCPLTELLLISVDWNIQPGNPTPRARFTLGGCYGLQRIGVAFTACTDGQWLPTRNAFQQLRTNEQGDFSFVIPYQTLDLRVRVKLYVDDCNCISLEWIGAATGTVTPLSYLDADALDDYMMVKHCCVVANDTSGFDHANAREQLGPCRAGRSIAMAIIAGFEVLNAVQHKFQSYLNIPAVVDPSTVSVQAAMVQATHDVLVHEFAAQKDKLSAKLNQDLSVIPNGQRKAAGIALGKQVAQLVLALRANDGSQHAEQRVGNGEGEYHLTGAPGEWSIDPISNVPIALGSRWAEVKPFVLTSANQFRAPPPPALDSPQYSLEYNHVKTLGGDGIITPTARTEDQTFVGLLHAYDGTPSLCAPVRFYNQILVHILTQERTNAHDMARALAVLNLAMADGGIAAWETKYYYKLWRPVGAIRRGNEDGNEQTIADATWTPLGAPLSNANGPNFTPPFPSFISGHSVFGACLAQTLRRVLGRDNVHFTIISDEYNGITKDNEGNVRPLKPRSYVSLSQFEEDSASGRYFLGIHFLSDGVEGNKMGRKIADWVFDHTYQEL